MSSKQIGDIHNTQLMVSSRSAHFSTDLNYRKFLDDNTHSTNEHWDICTILWEEQVIKATSIQNWRISNLYIFLSLVWILY